MKTNDEMEWQEPEYMSENGRMAAIKRRVEKLSELAYRHYDEHFVTEFYDHATDGKTGEYARALEESALYLCGLPDTRMRRQHWNSTAQIFLWQFTKD